MKKKNKESSFSAKLMFKIMYLANVVIDSVFSFKSSNIVITDRGFEFDSIAVILDSSICF